MRIALLHPTYWPEVRRGSERLAHDLGVSLVERGHQVTLLTSHAAPSTTEVEDGIAVMRARRTRRLAGVHLYEDHVENAPATVRRLLRGDFDVAHALHPADAWAAGHARRWGGPPVLFSVHGIIDREYLVSRRRRLELYRSAIARAGAVSALSAAAAEPFRRYALGEPVILPGGVISEHYAGERRQPERPTLLCASSLTDPRKRASLLFESFERIGAAGDVRLVVAAGRDPFRDYRPPAVPDGVEVVEIDTSGALAEAFRSATATVLPSVDEAFGLVLLESLAAGTPVVAARSGACPDVVDDEAIGRLFEPDDADGLAAAMAATLELGTREQTASACRAHAAAWDWGEIVPRYESLYQRLVLEGGR